MTRSPASLHKTLVVVLSALLAIQTAARADRRQTSTAGCPNPNGGACLGPMAAGQHTTTRFQPQLTYTVPSGWSNLEDYVGNYLLVPPGVTLAGLQAETSDFIG